MRTLFPFALLVASLMLSCSNDVRTGPSVPPSRLVGPRLRVLGIAQDGGIPHAACTCVRCDAGRQDPRRRHLIASLALIVPRQDASEGTWLVDATPDVREQLTLLSDARRPDARAVDRTPIDGVFLTHAHVGHYLGLAFFGFEAVHTRGLPTWCSPKMAQFLRTNGPWNQLVSINNIKLRELDLSTPVRILPGENAVDVRAMVIPHRDEFSDTLAFLFGLAGDESEPRVLYAPDSDPWRAWKEPLPAVIERLGIDVAILDGTFFSGDELPGRKVEEIRHPLMTDSMDLLEPMVRSGRLAVWFTHLNHSNPTLDPKSKERAALTARGFRIAEEGQEVPLRSPSR